MCTTTLVEASMGTLPQLYYCTLAMLTYSHGIDAVRTHTDAVFIIMHTIDTHTYICTHARTHTHTVIHVYNHMYVQPTVIMIQTMCIYNYIYYMHGKRLNKMP